ncbi:MAG: exodeoxyribonuclease III [Ignavibacteria bacterium]|nr:exodeoxyribonuclease III [Ignavibacteria bacterium]
MGKTKTIRIYSWNVNGLRAAHKKGLMEWVATEKPDVLCLQETKALPEQLPKELMTIKGYDVYYHSAKRKGYSGVAVYSGVKTENAIMGIGNEHFDNEGRAIILEYKDFVLVNCYFPNGGRGPDRVKYKLDFYDELFFLLQKNYYGRKGVIVTGDYNTAHKEIDLARPKENVMNSGFLPEERAWIDNIINLGYTDIFRKFEEGPGHYTYWDTVTRARERNVGWRIDYFMVSNDFVSRVKSARILSDVMGSDHCPIVLEILV